MPQPQRQAARFLGALIRRVRRPLFAVKQHKLLAVLSVSASAGGAVHWHAEVVHGGRSRHRLEGGWHEADALLPDFVHHKLPQQQLQRCSEGLTEEGSGEVFREAMEEISGTELPRLYAALQESSDASQLVLADALEVLAAKAVGASAALALLRSALVAAGHGVAPRAGATSGAQGTGGKKHADL